MHPTVLYCIVVQDFLGDNPTPADSRPIRPAATQAGTVAASSSGKIEDGVSGTVESVSTADAQLEEAIRLSLQQQQSVPSSATVSSSSSGSSSNSKNAGISAVVDLTEHSKQQAINTPQSGFLVSEVSYWSFSINHISHMYQYNVHYIGTLLAAQCQ